ncbi:polysaccharide lyase beta-sandwich domain-containing protein [Paenibacillus filicis]|uniref:Polysaccharide lyase beta-sandwich domain-containing protein n=1 Tax=Paenibacillus gyeongsangnamensis TaxID=3388067 RepID=A0ABT4Q236_9BACL|nr:polysaccharide lyase family 8 super-sandwich domain-containing protein [Paenibacillus filicis]MCZ8510954.1 polysaccharide lyase beta-sandwich domain-containing protein [Paenibacillus filicis]
MKTQPSLNGELIPESYWSSALECRECVHKLRKNTDERYSIKSRALEDLRRQIARTPFRAKTYASFNELDKYKLQLQEDGCFADLNDSFGDIYAAIMRLTAISEAFHWSREKPLQDELLKNKIFKGISYYCKLEADRTDRGWTRFHSSVFAIPVAVTNMFFFFLNDMEAIEKGAAIDQLAMEVHKQLSRCSLQAWTLPLRGDHTDSHPISIERFRKHVWWVGGNAVTYRPAFHTAVMLQSVQMIETLTYVVCHFLTPTSHTNNDESFWNEGICADGFGWGHGPQAYNSGYPKDGILSGLRIIKELQGTPWENEITCGNVDWLINFIRGICWSHYKDWDAPMQTRNIFAKKIKDDIDYIFDLAQLLIENFGRLLTEEQLREMNELLKRRDIQHMDGYPLGYYKGVRYFWNNDDLIKKTDRLYFYVNMASNRCSGVEFAHSMADRLNFFTADGYYVIARNGDEWAKSKGAWEIASLPGITARHVETAKLVPETNWSGYNSLHPFAGGVARDENGAAAFIFEKDDRRKADGAGIKHNQSNKEIFGVKAYKSYFIMEDMIVCLGAGISDLQPELGSEIRTTINQTSWATDIIYSSDERLPIEGHKGRFKVRGLESGKGIPWVKQDGILYAVFPEHTSGEVAMLAEERKSHWELLNSTNRQEDNETCKVFQLWINHGQAPVESKYSYLMYTGDQEPQTFLDSNPVRIISNTTGLQAVANKDHSILQAVFYDSGTVCTADTFSMKISHSAVVMLEQQGEELLVTVSDPCQDVNLKELIVYLTIPVIGESITAEEPWYAVPIKLPGKPEIGKPITVVLSLDKQ